VAYGLEIKHKKHLHLVGWFIWLSVFAAIVASGWYGYQYFTKGDLPPFISAKALQADSRVDETSVSNVQVLQHVVPKDEPRYISIPKIDVAPARVFSVGLDETNQLLAPSNISDTVWYNKSAKPGSGYGAILMDAHNGGITRNGVFANIKSLQVGDEITLERGDGEKFIYSVVENQSMHLEEVNKTGMKMMLHSANPDKEGLNLITSDGNWVPKYKQFDKRIMLRAVLVD